MRTCSKCNAENPDEAHFCHMCGEKLWRNKILEFFKEYNVFVRFILGIGLMIIGALLMDVAFWFGISLQLLGVGMMIWTIFNGES